MKKFKKGDKVKIIGNGADSQNKIGEIGIVTETHRSDCRVSVKGRKTECDWSYFVDLELVKANVDALEIF